VDDLRAGTENLADFITATVGYKGHCRDVRGGQVAASTHNVKHPYFASAIRTDLQSDATAFVADAKQFFGQLKRAFYVWVPTDDFELRSSVIAIGGKLESNKPPAMSLRSPIQLEATRYQTKAAATPEAFEHFGQTVEAGYESAGLGWLLRDQESYSAKGTTWAIAYEGDNAVGAACGYLSGATGGVYYVGTPPQHRKKGIGAEVTQWVVNSLFQQGAACVTLQSSEMGFHTYERLGFRVCGHYERFVVQAPEL
jgi:ribosomal protein S18 acetylase RimI-like enzyme